MNLVRPFLTATVLLALAAVPGAQAEATTDPHALLPEGACPPPPGNLFWETYCGVRGITIATARLVDNATGLNYTTPQEAYAAVQEYRSIVVACLDGRFPPCPSFKVRVDG